MSQALAIDVTVHNGAKATRGFHALTAGLGSYCRLDSVQVNTLTLVGSGEALDDVLMRMKHRGLVGKNSYAAAFADLKAKRVKDIPEPIGPLGERVNAALVEFGFDQFYPRTRTLGQPEMDSLSVALRRMAAALDGITNLCDAADVSGDATLPTAELRKIISSVGKI